MSGFRKCGRTSVQCEITLSHQNLGLNIDARTRDISETGIFVASRELSKHITIGDEVEAELRADIDHIKHANLIVVRLTCDGVGFSYG
ncbi:MAG: PilZ domain-containing protein [Alteromonadaceae bacterium]|nr:MAG: PilZ domain-containing protein [Alteromonadaceae bacterium]